LITIHLWTCKNCETKLFLRIDDQNPKHALKLMRFSTYVTKHCIEKKHQIIHKEKQESKIKYV